MVMSKGIKSFVLNISLLIPQVLVDPTSSVSKLVEKYIKDKFMVLHVCMRTFFLRESISFGILNPQVLVY